VLREIDAGEGGSADANGELENFRMVSFGGGEDILINFEGSLGGAARHRG